MVKDFWEIEVGFCERKKNYEKTANNYEEEEYFKGVYDKKKLLIWKKIVKIEKIWIFCLEKSNSLREELWRNDSFNRNVLFSESKIECGRFV